MKFSLFCCGLLLCVGSLHAQIPDSSLYNTWRLPTAVVTSDNFGAIFEIRPDSFFVRDDQDSLIRWGEWRIAGDTLVLIEGRLTTERRIDSVYYKVTDEQPVLRYYADGKLLASQSPGGLESARRENRYPIRHDESGNLILSEGETDYTFSGPAKLKEADAGIEDVGRAILGMVFLLGLCFVFSTNRRAINWQLVGVGVFLQLALALLILKVPGVSSVFRWIAELFVAVLGFTQAGSKFIFGSLVENIDSFGFIFAFQVLPTIIFFSALTSLLYYLGALQLIVKGFAWLLYRTMRLSGAESLAAAGNVFLGQTESPLLVKPYLRDMTRSEIHCLMVGGMATIAGSVFGAYVIYLGGDSVAEQTRFATHLLSASIMSAPAAIVAAKMLLPETEEVSHNLEVSKERIGANVLDAITNGATEGTRLAVNVAVMLLVFLAFVRGVDFFVADLFGHHTGLNDWVTAQTDGRYDQFSLQYIFGIVFAPVAWLIGVPGEDMVVVGQLLGEKTIINEFVAYVSLGTAKSGGLLLNEKSIIIATYALCGFANFGSIGIQIGGIGALAPSQRVALSALGIRALLGGTVAALMTAALAGVMVGW